MKRKKEETLFEENTELKREKNKKITDDTIEVDNFEVTKTGSLANDLMNFNKIKNVDVEKNELPDIELQEILIKDTGNYLNLKENYINIPIEMIVFPFFTPQKQNKRVNFKYYFQDLGVIMHSTLISKDKTDKVFQPSIFEEKIYMFLISMYLDKKNKKNLDIEEEAVIEFEISDFIVNFLGNKMNRTYYSKVEQALKNLKNTQYQFEISNHTKFGENKFEDKEFKLLTYQKLKTGKKIYYKVYLDKNIVNKIKSKRYIKYNTKNLLEIMTKDPIASRIYKYISKIRYNASSGRMNVRTLAAIIPLKIEQSTFRETKSGLKTYTLSRMKPVLTRIIKAFDVLVEMRYIKTFEEIFVREEDTYYISYIFNKERDGDCHTSEFINKSKEKNIYKEKFEEEEIDIDLSEDIVYSENIEDLIERVKENSKISPKWNKRVDNKISDILKKDGKQILTRVLNILLDLDTNISSTLVVYINSILKSIKKSKKAASRNLNLFENVSKGKGLKDKSQINQSRKRNMTKIGGKTLIKENNIENSYMDNNKEKNKDFEIVELAVQDILKENFDELTRMEIEEKALELLNLENGMSKEEMKNIKKATENGYYKILSNSIKKIIKEEYSD
ncbi:MAG: replication initiator protein A [Fusobacterium sp.]|nr:replication initiator protein A [Fusobacterium sp.]